MQSIIAALSLLAWLTTRAWAQTPAAPVPPPDAPSSTSTAGAVVFVGVAVFLIFGSLVKIMDLKRKRANEAIAVQAQVSAALLQDSLLSGLIITPTARVPLWKGSPVTVEVAGQVPSHEIRGAVLDLVEHEAQRLRPDVQIESRLGVVPSTARHLAV